MDALYIDHENMFEYGKTQPRLQRAPFTNTV